MNIFKPRPDVSPHLLRRFLTLCHVCGLISIPNYYREPWKTRYHSYFSKCVFIYFNIFLVCIALSVFINAIHDFGEFCMRFLEFLCLFIVHSELIYFRRNLGKFYELLTLIEGLARDHGHHPVVGRTQKMQKFFLYSSLLFMYNVIVGSKLLQTVLMRLLLIHFLLHRIQTPTNSSDETLLIHFLLHRIQTPTNSSDETTANSFSTPQDPNSYKQFYQ
ncbi:hypothetical protein WDU94_005488 [Cyamophila willieti]